MFFVFGLFFNGHPFFGTILLLTMGKIHLTNFRDLGGIKTKDGRRVKKGFLFRGKSLNGISEKAIDDLNRLGLTAIFDFRDEKDRLTKPDAKVEGATYYPCGVLELLGPEAQGSPVDIYYIQEVIAGKKMTKEEYEHSYQLFLRMYKEIPYAKDAFIQVFNAMSRHERIYYHCTGGKDRTGICSMIILWALGVDDKEIYRDYHYSNIARWRKNLWRLWHIFKGSKQLRSIKYMWKFLNCNKKNFKTAKHAIFSRYAKIEDFLDKVYGIDQQTIDDWKAFYLE